MDTVKICCVSDTHGFFPKIPDCDLLILAGDYCPTARHQQMQWFRDKFGPWVKELSNRMQVIGIAGNHDTIFEERPDLVPQMDWIYLQDSGMEWNGFKIWGTPWQPRYYDWAFNASEEELFHKWELIPDDTDILIVHGPPRGYGDYVPKDNHHAGSPMLMVRIREMNPLLVVTGHIHAGYGEYNIEETIVINASIMCDTMKPVNEPVIVELEKPVR